MAVTSNSKALEDVRLRKVRRLSVPGDVLVKEGDLVLPDIVIAKTEFVRGNPRIIDLNSEFRQKLTPEEVAKSLRKQTGDKVSVGELVATFQKGYWSGVDEVLSPCEGTIEFISKTQGRIVIREDPRFAKPLCIVAVSTKLDIWPWLIRMFTQVNEGDFVYEGQILASAMNLTNMDYVYAPMAGVIEKICPKTGTITIVRPVRPTQVTAHIAGKVTAILPDQGAVVEAVGAYLEGVFGIGGEKHGELAVAADGPGGTLEEAGINADHKGKILLAGGFATLEAVQKARSTGVKGLIVGGMDNLDLVQVLGREMNVGITGQEQTEFSVVVMEAFGPMRMSDRAWELLSSRSGRIASIDGTTHIRAGVIRPQVLVSDGADALSSITGEAYGVAREEPRPSTTNLKVGDAVRCVREPFTGLSGVVDELPAEPQRAQSEAFLEMASVRLNDGRTVLVAEANLEVLK